MENINFPPFDFYLPTINSRGEIEKHPSVVEREEKRNEEFRRQKNHEEIWDRIAKKAAWNDALMSRRPPGWIDRLNEPPY